MGRLHSLELPEELGDAAPLAAAGEVEAPGAVPALTGDRGTPQPADAAPLRTARRATVSAMCPPASPGCPRPAQPCHASVGHLAGDMGPLIKPPTFSNSPFSTEMGLFRPRRIWGVARGWLPEHHPWGLLTGAAPDTGHGDHGGDTCPRPHLLCHPLQLLPDVREEEAVEALFIGPSLDQPAGVVLQEGQRGHVPGAVGGAGLGTGGCRAPGTHQAVLMDAEPVLTAQLPDHLGVTVCPPAQPTHCWDAAALLRPAPVPGCRRG